MNPDEPKKNLPAPAAKMTLEEYKAKYTRPQNYKAARLFLFLFAASIGVIVFTCLLLIVLRIHEINEVAGYISIVPAVAAFGLFYVFPLVKIHKLPAFQTNVDQRNARAAQIHNRKMREDIADHMIDFAAKTDNVGWYDESRIGKLAVARQTKDNDGLRLALTEIYDQDVRKMADKLIRSAATKVGIFTALSQSDRLDTAIVAMYELNLVKDLLYLYGYRPSEPRLMRIYASVVRDSLIAYGASASTPAILHSLTDNLAPSLGILGGILSTVIGSTSQGLINGALTVVIGVQTKRYLRVEYRLQDLLDGIELEGEDEAVLMEEVKKDIGKTIREGKKKPKPQE
ncbi:MAG: DUF697 domain-containing protein [Bacilli bacterium]|nr:DUF697 domain-containing protein [Bacilli bacterium]